MSATPPPLPPRKDLRRATLLNVMLPGAGLYYLGWRRAGLAIGISFGAAFLVVVAVFLSGYIRYLSIAMSEDLMKGDNLEQAGAGFHLPWLIGMAGLGAVLYLVSWVMFAAARKQFV